MLKFIILKPQHWNKKKNKKREEEEEEEESYFA